MSELVVFVFRDQYRAPEVLNELRRRDWDWVCDLDDAVAVTLNKEGRAKVYISVDLSTHESANWARIWGSLLSATLFLPSTEGLVEVSDGVARSTGLGVDSPAIDPSVIPTAGWKECLLPSDDFIRDVAGTMAWGGSAVFMFLRGEKIASVLAQLSNYGDTIIHTSLSPEQERKMQAMLVRDGKPVGRNATALRVTKEER